MKNALVPLLMLVVGVVAGHLTATRSPAEQRGEFGPESVVVLKADRNYTLEVKRVTDSATNDDASPREWVLILQTPGRKPVALVCEER